MKCALSRQGYYIETALYWRGV